jgi:hypothetical protein
MDRVGNDNSARDPHLSAFDGHLEHPMQSLSDCERLKLIWEGTLLMHWARNTKLREPVARFENELRPDERRLRSEE